MSNHRSLYFLLLVFIGSISFGRVPKALHPNAQSLLRTCSFSGPVSNFCNVNVRDQLCVNGNQINGGFGNTLRVDKVYGDDETGQRNGSPFLTIQAALDAAEFGDLVWVFPGIYDEKITIPDGVSVSAAARNTVTIQQLNVTTPTDLVTIGQGSYLGNCILQMSSSVPVQLRAIFHAGANIPGTIVVIDTNQIFIDNSAAVGSSDVYGIYMTGTGSVGFLGDIIFDTIIQVTTGSGSAGIKRAIYIDSPTLLEIITPIFQMFGGTDTIAFEVNNPACVVAVQAGAMSGDFFTGTPDISQTQGSIQLDVTYLGNSNANELGFTMLAYPTSLIWSEPDALIGGGTFNLLVGGGISTNPIPLRAAQKFVAQDLSVEMATPPGIGESIRFILHKNGVPTNIDLTITDGNTSGVLSNVSVHFDVGDGITMEMINSAGSLAGQVLLSLAIY